MSVVLTRVDDRLIHGQVVVGWGQALLPDRFVLADDEIAVVEWEHEVYRAGVPTGTEIEFVTVEEAAARVAAWDASEERTVLLFADVNSALRLFDLSSEIVALNLGGVHASTGRSQRLPYLYLSDEEIERLVLLQKRGVQVTAQDLPLTRPVAIEELCRSIH